VPCCSCEGACCQSPINVERRNVPLTLLGEKGWMGCSFRRANIIGGAAFGRRPVGRTQAVCLLDVESHADGYAEIELEVRDQVHNGREFRKDIEGLAIEEIADAHGDSDPEGGMVVVIMSAFILGEFEPGTDAVAGRDDGRVDEDSHN